MTWFRTYGGIGEPQRYPPDPCLVWRGKKGLHGPELGAQLGSLVPGPVPGPEGVTTVGGLQDGSPTPGAQRGGHCNSGLQGAHGSGALTGLTDEETGHGA
ncbi:hypothetical protein NDU88_002985 [Pleurodeles waltl]|uniref:Uncharacterized protein n=1 Tax=Pleurodeles waltl TaxID=8319 RepID=A0AAV7TMT2_PLEWA|nr:hypothetical protein NDU88_002985 [Pleurodeles waltl]